MGPNPDRAPTRTGPQPGPGPMATRKQNECEPMATSMGEQFLLKMCISFKRDAHGGATARAAAGATSIKRLEPLLS